MKMKRVASPRSVPIYLKYLQELKIWVIFESLVAEHPISMTEEERKKKKNKKKKHWLGMKQKRPRSFHPEEAA